MNHKFKKIVIHIGKWSFLLAALITVPVILSLAVWGSHFAPQSWQTYTSTLMEVYALLIFPVILYSLFSLIGWVCFLITRDQQIKLSFILNLLIAFCFLLIKHFSANINNYVSIYILLILFILFLISSIRSSFFKLSTKQKTNQINQ